MLQAIHHVAIICADYQRSKHFYHQLLGLADPGGTLSR